MRTVRFRSSLNISRHIHKFELGCNYRVQFGYREDRFVICKLIKVTKTGYNFLNIETNKCIMKQHLYPTKMRNHITGDQFCINAWYRITKVDE